MKKTAFLTILVVLWVIVLDSSELTWKPKRVNKAIELLEAGQPIYCTDAHGGYEEGREMAQTWADHVNYDMEHPLLSASVRFPIRRNHSVWGDVLQSHSSWNIQPRWKPLWRKLAIKVVEVVGGYN